MSEQENTNIEQPIDNQVIEVEWEEVKELHQLREYMLEVESNLSAMMLQFEKRKAAMLHRSREIEVAIHQAGTKLREDKQLDTESTYELKLPTTEGEKAYFIRKDDQN